MPVLLLLFGSCVSERTVVCVPAKQSIEIDYPNYDLFNVNLKKWIITAATNAKKATIYCHTTDAKYAPVPGSIYAKTDCVSITHNNINMIIRLI